MLGNANGVKYGPHCLGVPKQRSAVLRPTPRGSNPDEIEMRADGIVVEERAGEKREVDAGAARAARVQEQ